jgi:hypothetical protein
LEARAEIMPMVIKNAIREKTTKARKEARNILKKLLISTSLYVANIEDIWPLE